MYESHVAKGEISVKSRKKRKTPAKQESKDQKPSIRNRPLHIPLDFEQAVDALLNTKPKKKHRNSSSE